jgi:hypothetical protein
MNHRFGGGQTAVGGLGPSSLPVSLIVVQSENPRVSLHEDMQELKGGIM